MNENNEKFNCLANHDPIPRPYWLTSTDQKNHPPLEKDITVDVAIVGGGMVGITSAWLLKQAGLSVAIVEADHILQGTTGHTTAKITSQHGLIYDKITNKMGNELASQYAQANESAIHFIADLIKEKEISCDFSWQPAYVYTQSPVYVQKLIDETKAASSLGLMASYVESLPLPFDIQGAMKFEDQAQFHPRKYLLSLAKDIVGDNSYIFEQTRAVDIQEGSLCQVITHNNNKKVTASHVIIASHYPFYDKPGLYFARIYQERSYILGAKIKGDFPKGMFINAEQPTRSLRTQPMEDGELVLIGGENHKSGHGQSTLKHYEALCQFAHKHFDVEDILFRWSTQDCVTMDNIPYIGHLTADRPNVYVATGFGKWGMTNSTVSAIMLRDLIVKGENPWTSVYYPSRIRPQASATEFIVQNVDVATRFISGKLIPNSKDMNLQPGQGKVLQIKGQRVGAYCDENGEIHVVDTTCTHLGCELTWNDAEKSWDCPCHGSRFSYTGDIIEGPALKPLQKLQ
ncbi:FAD dependent oxidoreductase [Alkaliphilus metalliredigens QYMF]|uniref:FAD dependent oxidoreductase n=1 Tax=Alkaliphilus metalliredigens (strain QYMF) TaxID=293826 RepID=A6TX15_ALKMQ|nr:FAD-dependent oxidoreductase [Alkaliphilus metalliredigens]ABR50733.1 FAD dependent oxidoreductase [Alkaliphilus metalliredigens QYMF]